MSRKPSFAVGIDLGTTNSALAAVPLGRGRRDRPRIESFAIPQGIEVGETDSRLLLPSFAYLAAEHEEGLAPSLPFGADPKVWIGEVARRQGMRVPGRLVASAKSWLCHKGVDRRAEILPWQGDVTGRRLSPVEASARYLGHLRAAWNHAHPEAPLEDQHVVLTIPASFDEVARELSLEAARSAGLEEVTLIEEPQAAFYDWMYGGPANARPLPMGSVALVVDCGGGTTDFSLIAVKEHHGEASYERQAVGEHLLLGGDNFDIALAHQIEKEIGERRLDPTQWGNLVLACRRAKESLLAADAPDEETVVILGRGQKVIGGSTARALTRASARATVLEGFFPKVAWDAPLGSGPSPGLKEYGLPFVTDPAITRHLASFLRQHLAPGVQPEAVLFNGGVFLAPLCRERLLEVLADWFGSAPQVLTTTSLELAVARGAAAYGWARRTGAARIKSAAARSVYLAVTSQEEDDTKRTAICIVPHGLEEGHSVTIDQLPLELQLGEPVSFPLLTSTVRTGDRAGDRIQVGRDELAELSTLTTVLRAGKKATRQRVQVALEAQLTEIGTLELYCVGKGDSRRWKLEFQTRTATRPDGAEIEIPSRQRSAETWSRDQLAGPTAVIERAFSSKDAQALVGIMKDLERSLEMPRLRWPSAATRPLFEALAGLAPTRKRSLEHECRWLNLTGFLLRPGLGDPLDPLRVEQLWKMVHQGPVVSDNRAWSEFWILARRIAAGLDGQRQRELANRLLPYVQTQSGRKPPRRVGSAEESEIWRALASLEQLEVGVKAALGELLRRELKRRPLPRHVFWCLARLGARVPLAAPVNLMVAPQLAHEWLKTLLAFEPADRQEAAECSFAMANIARRTGDRVRDIDDDFRQQVLTRLDAWRADPHWIRMVRELTELEAADEDRLWGESAPPGLTLHASPATPSK